MLNIGVDLGGHTILAALADFGGEKPHVLSRLEAVTAPGREPKAVMAQISQMASALLKGASAEAVGVGVPGFVCGDRRRVARMTNFNAAEAVDFADMLEEELVSAGCGSKVYIENDANCAALGEGMCGAARGCRDYVVLTLGTGTGSGIVAGGRLLSGAHGMGGEAGHMALVAGGTRCGCGGTGHLESAASADWVEKKALTVGLPGDFKAIWNMRHDKKAAEILAPAMDALARGIASLVAVTDPELVVISGGMSRAEGIAEELTNRVWPYLAAPFRGVFKIVISELGGDAAVIGAAGLGGYFSNADI